MPAVRVRILGLTAVLGLEAALVRKALDGLVADERTTGLPVLETGVLMDTEGARRQLAEQTLQFALALA